MAGGIDWFRWHHGSVTDPKFALVARKAGTTLPNVLSVWAFLLEQASASDERGAFGSIDCEAIDCLFGFDDGVTASIVQHMQARDLVEGDRVKAWEKRQPKRERDDDKSSDRVRAFRERQRQEQPGNADETPGNATERQETPRGEERREEEKKEEKTEGKPARKRADSHPCPDGVDAGVWADWLQLRKAKRAPVTETAIDGARAEAAKAGMTLEAFLRVWCRRGSQGLEAAWLTTQERGPPAEPAWRTEQRERTAGFAGPAAAKRPPALTNSQEIFDADARFVG